MSSTAFTYHITNLRQRCVCSCNGNGCVLAATRQTLSNHTRNCPPADRGRSQVLAHAEDFLARLQPARLVLHEQRVGHLQRAATKRMLLVN